MVRNRIISGNQLFGGIEEDTLEGLEDAMEHTISVAVNNAPLETGALRRSATVSRGGQKVLAYKGENGQIIQQGNATHGRNNDKCIYGSFNTPYAHRQHEKINWRHLNGGTAKYFENAHQSEKHLIPTFIKRRLRLGGRR